MRVSWDCALGFWWFLPRPLVYEAHVLCLAPPALASTAGAQRGAGEAEGPARANTAPVCSQRKQPWVNISSCRTGQRNVQCVPCGLWEGEGGWSQELTQEPLMSLVQSLSVWMGSRGWKCQGSVLGHSASGQSAMRTIICVFHSYSSGVSAFLPVASGVGRGAAEGRSVSTGLGVRNPGF